jgi:hypothetical protein
MYAGLADGEPSPLDFDAASRDEVGVGRSRGPDN